MQDYVIIFKEWDELGHVTQRTVRITLKTDPKEWFWKTFSDSDVDLVTIKKVN